MSGWEDKISRAISASSSPIRSDIPQFAVIVFGVGITYGFNSPKIFWAAIAAWVLSNAKTFHTMSPTSPPFRHAR